VHALKRLELIERLKTMVENDETLVAEYGITVETKLVFHYDGRRYDRLADAVSYARIQRALADERVASRERGDRVV
jgi:hypothetical protein